MFLKTTECRALPCTHLITTVSILEGTSFLVTVLTPALVGQGHKSPKNSYLSHRTCILLQLLRAAVTDQVRKE